MTRALSITFIGTLLLGLCGSALADEPTAPDHRAVYKGVFFGSLAVAAAGGGMWAYGVHRVGNAEYQLCTGSNRISCDHPAPTDAATIARYNDQGSSGHTLALTGGIAVALAGGVAVFAFYKGFIEKEPSASASLAARHHSPGIVVAPVVTPSGGGATLRIDW